MEPLSDRKLCEDMVKDLPRLVEELRGKRLYSWTPLGQQHMEMISTKLLKIKEGTETSFDIRWVCPLWPLPCWLEVERVEELRTQKAYRHNCQVDELPPATYNLRH